MRVCGIQRDDVIARPAVGIAGGGVEVVYVGGEGEQQGAQLVGDRCVVGCMAFQCLHSRQRTRQRHPRLGGEPSVHHRRLLVPSAVEVREHGLLGRGVEGAEVEHALQGC